MNFNAIRMGSGRVFHRYRKILLVMRITTILLLITAMTVSAASFGQQITLHEKKAGLEEVLKKVRQQSGYDFVYSQDLFLSAKPVNIDLNQASLEEALKAIFRDQPLQFEITDGAVIFKQKDVSFFDKIKQLFAQFDAKGTVTDETGKPVTGATVKLKNGKSATLTDEKGRFVLRNCQPGDIVMISFVGFNTKEVKAAEDMEGILLEVATSILDEVVVKPYGVTSQRLSTSTIGVVNAKDIANQPVTNPLLALQGQVPGLEIEQATGLANSGVVVRIRGINSVNGSLPFYVIDGIPYTNTLLPSVTGSNLGVSGSAGPYNYAGNPLSFINPNDIESISVLKDADATAIYGSRASAGAILITTKKAKSGDTRVNFNFQDGWGHPASDMKVLNLQQYLVMRREAFANSGETPGPSDYDLNGVWDQTQNRNWQKLLLGNAAQFLNSQVSITGGNRNVQYLVSGNYNRQTTVFPTDRSDRKGSLHFNISSQSSNEKFRMQFTGSYMDDMNQIPFIDLTTLAYQLSPNAPALYNSDGSLNWANDSNGNPTWTNPLAAMSATNENHNNNLTSNIHLSYQLLKGLQLKTSLGYNNMQVDERLLYPSTVVAPQFRSTAFRYSQFSNGHISSWIAEPQLTYQREIGKGKLDVLIGGTIQTNTGYQQNILARRFTADQLEADPGAASSIQVRTGLNTIYKYAALFSRLDYNWDDRYLITLSGRRDGSSRFGANNMYHDFWSASGAWIFSNEGWLKDNSVLSFGKLRASYGTTGSDQIADYQFYSIYRSSGTNTYDGVSGLTPAGLPNPNLQWEETRKFQVGGDLGFLNDRVLFGISYYRNQSSNQLLGYTLPGITGFTTITSNFPATVQNTGFEMTLNTENVRSSDFKWTSSFNISVSRNKLLAFPSLATSSYHDLYVIGQPISIVKVYQYAGLDPQTGLYTFLTKSGSITSSPDLFSDRTVTRNTLPVFFGGFKNSFTYKSWALDIVAQFAKQTGLNSIYGNLPGYYYAGYSGNQPATILDRWPQSTGPQAVQKPFATYSDEASNAFYAISSSTFAYSDASYIRLKNVALSYGFPTSWVKYGGMQSCRLYVHAENLLTITNYKGLDPETQNVNSLPPLRIWTLGIQAGF